MEKYQMYKMNDEMRRLLNALDFQKIRIQQIEDANKVDIDNAILDIMRILKSYEFVEKPLVLYQTTAEPDNPKMTIRKLALNESENGVDVYTDEESFPFDIHFLNGENAAILAAHTIAFVGYDVQEEKIKY